MKSRLGLEWGNFSQVKDIYRKLSTKLKAGEKRFTVLSAMQSGKTAFIQCLIEKLAVEGPHRVVYLCSYDRVSYKAQIENDLGVFEPEECCILVGKDILRYSPRPNDIVIVDEAGYGVSENQRLDRALKAVNATVIAVSATPYEAMKSKWKGIILTPSKKSLAGYYGVNDMLDRRKVFQAQPILEGKKRKNITEWFQTVLDSMPVKAYGIVRVGNKKEATVLQRLLIKQGIVSETWVQGSPLKRPIIQSLSTMPRRKKVFIVVNHLRMGERIVDKYLHFVVERLPRCKSMNNTIAQSLLGRCCGWDKTPGKVTIYTDVVEAKQYGHMWDELWNNKKEISMMDRPNAARNFEGSVTSGRRINAAISIVDSFDNLPEEVRDNMERRKIKSRTGKYDSRVAWIASNKDKKVVESKSYFGRGEIGENNRRKVVAALQCVRDGDGITTDFGQFAGRHKNSDKVSDYAVFGVYTDELYEEYGIKAGQFILLTKCSDWYMLNSNTVSVKDCLFTTLAEVN